MKRIHVIQFKDKDFEKTVATTPEEIKLLVKASWIKYDELDFNGQDAFLWQTKEAWCLDSDGSVNSSALLSFTKRSVNHRRFFDRFCSFIERFFPQKLKLLFNHNLVTKRHKQWGLKLEKRWLKKNFIM
jgi:hypothetical protein